MRTIDLPTLLRRSGLYFLVSLSLALLSLYGFAELADEVLEAESRGFDRAVLRWVNAHVRPEWTPYVLELSFIGSPLGISLCGLLFGVLLLARRKAWDALTLLVVLLGGGAQTVSLKALFRQPRPDLFPPLTLESSFGFPSGHALVGFCFFGYVAYWLVAQGPTAWWRWVLAALSVGTAVLISLSRLYLGVHWPTDLVAGALAAVFWLSCCLAIRRWIAETRTFPIDGQ